MPSAEEQAAIAVRYLALAQRSMCRAIDRLNKAGWSGNAAWVAESRNILEGQIAGVLRRLGLTDGGPTDGGLTDGGLTDGTQNAASRAGLPRRHGRECDGSIQTARTQQRGRNRKGDHHVG